VKTSRSLRTSRPISRIRNGFVIARNTAFTLKGKNVDAKEISKRLAVRYVLEGSVQGTRTGYASTGFRRFSCALIQ
jgi:hypothetical protein